MGKIENIGLIVEGHTELLAFQRTFKRSNIKIASRFSGEARLETVAEEIASLVRILSTSCKSVIAIFDREQRTKSSKDLAAEVKKLVASAELKGVNLEVVCPDKMVENWILADVDSCKQKKYIKKTARQKNYEGSNGVTELKKLFIKEADYSKTSHGVELLSLIRPAVARKNSPSFRCFFDMLP